MGCKAVTTCPRQFHIQCAPEYEHTQQHIETQPSRDKAEGQDEWEGGKEAEKKRAIEIKTKEKQHNQILSIIKHLILLPYKAGARGRSKSNQI